MTAPTRASHTPGPWHRLGQLVQGFHVRDGQRIGQVVCEVSDNQSHEANARLIAAAPELRELIERLAHSEKHNPTQIEIRQLEARALLARIDGATS